MDVMQQNRTWRRRMRRAMGEMGMAWHGTMEWDERS
jgi:hypothetical protein